jgi:hypothetical protein
MSWPKLVLISQQHPLKFYLLVVFLFCAASPARWRIIYARNKFAFAAAALSLSLTPIDTNGNKSLGRELCLMIMLMCCCCCLFFSCPGCGVCVAAAAWRKVLQFPSAVVFFGCVDS